MGYQIDVAFDMRIVGSMTNLSEEFVNKAEKNNCEMYYMNYEMEGEGRTIVRNHSVMTFLFPSEKQYIINFIRFVREFRDAYIESISNEDKKMHPPIRLSQISLHDGYMVCQKVQKISEFIIKGI